MTDSHNETKLFRLHLTNIAGLGAIQLAYSLLPCFEQLSGYKLDEIYLPSRGELSTYNAFNKDVKVVNYKRHLPNSISRFLECTIFAGRFDNGIPVLVLGDIPLRIKSKQIVFVQTPLLTASAKSDFSFGDIKYYISSLLFRLNAKYVSSFIVQTAAMKEALIATYPEIRDRVAVVGQPPPNWLLNAKLRRTQRNKHPDDGLRLFYPAAVYPHKNHQLLAAIKPNTLKSWPISELLLTIPQNLNPNPAVPWIHCIDRLNSDMVVDTYKSIDALLFLSLSESFGFPLVEAMWVGLPIICPDLPYAKVLCGDQAIYFNPEDISSLHEAVLELETRLLSGWWPTWEEKLKLIPHDWSEVAHEMLKLISY